LTKRDRLILERLKHVRECLKSNGNCGTFLQGYDDCINELEKTFERFKVRRIKKVEPKQKSFLSKLFKR